jgi:hypothetical protein
MYRWEFALPAAAALMGASVWLVRRIIYCWTRRMPPRGATRQALDDCRTF